jgi:hypothetical protein
MSTELKTEKIHRFALEKWTLIAPNQLQTSSANG